MIWFTVPQVPLRGVAVWIVAAAALAGCLQGLDYQRPSLEIPTSWEQVAAGDLKTGVLITTQTLPEATWWRTFATPGADRHDQSV